MSKFRIKYSTKLHPRATFTDVIEGKNQNDALFNLNKVLATRGDEYLFNSISTVQLVDNEK